MTRPRHTPETTRLALALLAVAAVLALACTARARGLLLNSVELAAGAAAIALPAGIVWGLALGKAVFPGRRLLAAVTVAALFVPLQVYAAAWQTLLGFDGWTTGGGPGDPWLDGLAGAIWVHGWAAAPWVAVLITWSLEAVERRLEEEALLDATAARVLLRVSLRRAAGGVLAAAVTVFALCAAEIGVTDLFRVRTFAEEVYTQAALGSLSGGAMPADDAAALREARDLTAGTLAHWLLGGAVLLLAAPLVPRPAEADSEAGWRLTPRSSPKLNAALAAAAALLTAVAVVAPALGLAWKAGLSTARTAEGATAAWSLAKCLRMTGRAPLEHGRELLWSLGVAALAAAAVMIVSVVVASWGRRSRGARLTAGAVAAAALAVPGPLVGVGAILLLAHGVDSPWHWLTPMYDRTVAAPALVQAIRALPLAGLVVWTQLASVPQGLLDAAASEGAGPWSRWVRIALPLRAPGLAAACAVALVLAVGEVSATLLVYPPGVTPLSVRISQLLHYGVDDRVAALSLALLLGTVALGTAASFALAIWQDRRLKKNHDRHADRAPLG